MRMSDWSSDVCSSDLSTTCRSPMTMPTSGTPSTPSPTRRWRSRRGEGRRTAERKGSGEGVSPDPPPPAPRQQQGDQALRHQRHGGGLGAEQLGEAAEVEEADRPDADAERKSTRLNP